MDVDGPFGERALLLFTVIESEAISVLYKISWSLFFDNRFMVLDRIVWVNIRNKKPLDRIYRMNRISQKTLFKDPVNPVILSEKGFAFVGTFESLGQ